MKKRIFFCLLIILHTILIFAQEKTTSTHSQITIGLHYSPILPSDFFKAGKTHFTDNNVDFDLQQKYGYSGGMIIRKEFTNLFSIETSINFIQRKYQLTIYDKDNQFNGTSTFKSLGTEIPVLALVYVRLGDKIFMNTAFGFSMDMFPSDVGTFDDYFIHNSYRKNWIITSLLANLGYDYRTKRNGIFYIGVSYHRPFTYMYFTEIKYSSDTKNAKARTDLSGNYLTLDFRYFFKEKKTKKEDK